MVRAILIDAEIAKNKVKKRKDFGAFLTAQNCAAKQILLHTMLRNANVMLPFADY